MIYFSPLPAPILLFLQLYYWQISGAFNHFNFIPLPAPILFFCLFEKFGRTSGALNMPSGSAPNPNCLYSCICLWNQVLGMYAVFYVTRAVVGRCDIKIAGGVAGERPPDVTNSVYVFARCGDWM